jgi:predicted  nucleic acid-binding Zn-ribbon protein
MTDERNSGDEDEELPGCPDCGSGDVERTPAARFDYQCLDCGHEYDEGGHGVIVE